MKIQFTTRIEQETIDKVKEIADTESRSVNNTIEWLLREAIKNYEESIDRR